MSVNIWQSIYRWELHWQFIAESYIDSQFIAESYIDSQFIAESYIDSLSLRATLTVSLSLRSTTYQCIYRYVNLLYHKHYMFRPPVVPIFRKCSCTLCYTDCQCTAVKCQLYCLAVHTDSSVVVRCATVSVYSATECAVLLLQQCVLYCTARYGTVQYGTVQYRYCRCVSV